MNTVEKDIIDSANKSHKPEHGHLLGKLHHLHHFHHTRQEVERCKLDLTQQWMMVYWCILIIGKHSSLTSMYGCI
jgi:hypothetical protein